MDDREMMRDASTFEEDIMHGATASNLLLEAEPGPANLPDKSNHMEYDDFGDGSMGNTDGGMLGMHLSSIYDIALTARLCDKWSVRWIEFIVREELLLILFIFQLTSYWALKMEVVFLMTLQPSQKV